MSDQRVATTRPRLWRLTIKAADDLPEDLRKQLPPPPRSPRRLYLESAGSQSAKPWEQMNKEERKPFVKQYLEERKRRAKVKSLLWQKQAVVMYLQQLEERVGKLKAGGEAPQQSVTEEMSQPGQVQTNKPRGGWRGAQAIKRFKKVFMSGLPENEQKSLRPEDVHKAWKALSSAERRSYFSRKPPVSTQSV